MHGLESVFGEPMLRRLGHEMLQEQIDLQGGKSIRKRQIQIRAPEVTVILQNLVFQNQMVPECIPGQVGQHPVILMSIISVMGEDNIGVEFRLNLFKPVFDRYPFARKIALAK